MEANKIQGEAKSIVLDNGAEITYCERGEQNQEVIVCGAFYIHTFMPVIEELAKKYHVYGVIMRFDGPCDELMADGKVNWSRQWGKDVYDFACKMGLEKFTYFGKCHGTIPGWYLVKEHPEMLKCFGSFFLAPHVKPQVSNLWFEMLAEGPQKMMSVAMRKPEQGLPKKMAELQSIGPNVNSPAVPEFGSAAEKVWDSVEDCDEALRHMTVPVCYCFGTKDPIFRDHYDSNIYAMENTLGARSIILQGECHLMEIDCPDRIADEMMKFMETCDAGFYEELLEKR